MPPKIVFTNQMIIFVSELYKQLKAKCLNLKQNLSILFNAEFGTSVSYTKLASVVNMNSVVPDDIVYKISNLSLLLNKILIVFF